MVLETILSIGRFLLLHLIGVMKRLSLSAMRCTAYGFVLIAVLITLVLSCRMAVMILTFVCGMALRFLAVHRQKTRRLNRVALTRPILIASGLIAQLPFSLLLTLMLSL